jgi:hypothetical protein
MGDRTIDDLGRPRWRGQPGRLEVWYATFTDPVSGTGVWLHHEVVAPPATGAPPYAHGWAAVFAPGAEPRAARFGPEEAKPRAIEPDEPWFRAAGVEVDGATLQGEAGTAGDEAITWDLLWGDDARPVMTFPRAAWERELLPAAQIVPAPTARFTGRVSAAGRTVRVDRAVGAVARIYGHGNAERWAWLHADLGDGDVLEVVAAVPRRPVLRRIRPVPMVQLRVGGEDWPTNPLLAAPRFRARVGLPEWTVRGVSGRRRLTVTVVIPPERAIVVAYADPDGATATCTNTERADADVLLEHYDGSWREERRWRLDATAHAEVGERP